ncbi:hypothetical protein L3Q82_001997 [Scortum barcoo]|uniref:Uncharacterized protein n=1 Tax=Scortum barcoo TaxID=214431 RepID=A0ACB8W1S7_9TELE|nr:hypothetical protein L3Q82_001997 [Scortum barcoo]
MEKEIAELKMKDAELERLSHTEDHTCFLHAYPSLSQDRFTNRHQVLSRESLNGRCYFEVVWSGGALSVAVAHKNISRVGDESLFGYNDKLWALECFKNGYEARHNKVRTPISGPQSSRIGVYLDHRSRVQTTFTQPLFAGFWIYVGSSVELCEHKEKGNNGWSAVVMEEEMQQLRELMLQLKADNERLRQEQAALLEGSGGASSSPAPVSNAPSAGAAAVVTERLVVIPRDRKCPMFNGKTGIGIAEWIEELQACVRARRLSVADQALFIFDHLEGEAKEEIKFRSSGEQGDPARVLAILKELYGCTESYVTLQQAFFSRHQLEGETLQEFSLALMALMDRKCEAVCT